MPVPRLRKRARPTVDRSGAHDRQLSGERQIALREDRPARRRTEPAERGAEILLPLDQDLRPTVVATRRGLEPHRQAQLGGGILHLRVITDLAPRRDGDALLLEEPPLGQPVLRDGDGVRPRADRPLAIDRLDDVEPDVLELDGDDVGGRGEVERRADVRVPPLDDAIRDGGRGARRVRVEHGDPVAQLPSRDGQHPPELSPAEDPDRGRRQDRWIDKPEATEGATDPLGLGHRVAVRVEHPRSGDRALPVGILGAQCGVCAKCVPEGEVARVLPAVDAVAAGMHVQVDPVPATLALDRSAQERPGRRERARARRSLEPEFDEELGDRRNVVRVRLDREVHDVLAREPRHGGAADVLDEQVAPPRVHKRRHRAGGVNDGRVPVAELEGRSLVRADRLRHGPECRSRGTPGRASTPRQHVPSRRALAAAGVGVDSWHAYRRGSARHRGGRRLTDRSDRLREAGDRRSRLR